MAPEQVRVMLEATGGSAFPSEQTVEGGGTLTMSGMTLRDYFAVQMMPVAERIWPFAGAKDSMNGTRIAINSPSGMGQLAHWRKDVVTEAYALADAMLAERRK